MAGMYSNMGAAESWSESVNFSGNSKIVAEGVVVFNNENNGKTRRIGFIYNLKGFLVFRGVTSWSYGMTCAGSGGKW